MVVRSEHEGGLIGLILALIIVWVLAVGFVAGTCYLVHWGVECLSTLMSAASAALLT